MSTYGTAGVSYGTATGTYGDLELGDVPAESMPVPSPTYTVGPSARTSVTGGDGRSAVSGPVGTTVSVGGSG